MALVALGVCGLATAVGLALGAFNENLVFFYSPSQVVAGEAPVARSFRIGGLVEEGSLRRGTDGLIAYFTITDTVHSIQVAYAGILPDLFKEGRGCVAQGKVSADDGVFHAELVLAKHDENYMPAEVAQSIEDASRRCESADVPGCEGAPTSRAAKAVIDR
jgi:cytochrome c-type biogenesis protein CcmE